MPRTLLEVLRACLDDQDEQAWRELHTRTKTLLAVVLMRVARKWEASTDCTSDLAQDLYLKIFQEREKLRVLIAKCPNDDAAMAYLAAMAANLARDYFKAITSEKRGGNLLVPLDETTQEIAAPVKVSAEQTVLLRQIEGRVDRLTSESARDRTIFWLYYRQGFTSESIAAVPAFKLSTKGVESILARLTRKLREEMVNTAGAARANKGIASSTAFNEGEA